MNFDKLAEKNGVSIYAQKVNKLVRERYSIADELAIQRQRETKPEEFQAYYDYVEWCKEEARK